MAKQRIAVVTGGMGGLGETISTKMADAGCTYMVLGPVSAELSQIDTLIDEIVPHFR